MPPKDKNAPKPSAKVSATVPLPPTRLTNEQDNAVLAELESAPFGSLELDRFADLLSLKRQSGDPAIIELRSAITFVYVRRAIARAERRASQAELHAAETGLKFLWRAVQHLEGTTPEHTRGLRGGFAIPADDPKGLDEATDFSSFCSRLRSEIVAVALRFDAAVRAERAKPTQTGKPKERLRFLIEGLSELWFAATDKTISPSVKSNRRDHGARSVVHGRSGVFVDFAKSVLFELDSFNPTEIESAVTNVAKRRSRRSMP